MTIANAYGVESICTVVPIAPSTYFWHKARHRQIPRDGAHGSTATTGGDRETSARLGSTTSRYMARARSGGNCDATATDVARCTVGRLMRAMGLRWG